MDNSALSSDKDLTDNPSADALDAVDANVDGDLGSTEEVEKQENVTNEKNKSYYSEKNMPYYCVLCIMGFDELEDFKIHYNEDEQHEYHASNRIANLVSGLGYCTACHFVVQKNNVWKHHSETVKHKKSVECLKAIGMEEDKYSKPYGCPKNGELGDHISPEEIDHNKAILNGFGKRNLAVIPIIGLNHMTEEVENERYKCGVCDTPTFGFKDCVTHVTSFNHRRLHLEKNYKEWYDDVMKTADNKNRMKYRASFYAYKVEKLEKDQETETAKALRLKMFESDISLKKKKSYKKAKNKSEEVVKKDEVSVYHEHDDYRSIMNKYDPAVYRSGNATDQHPSHHPGRFDEYQPYGPEPGYQPNHPNMSSWRRYPGRLDNYHPYNPVPNYRSYPGRFDHYHPYDRPQFTDNAHMQGSWRSDFAHHDRFYNPAAYDNPSIKRRLLDPGDGRAPFIDGRRPSLPSYRANKRRKAKNASKKATAGEKTANTENNDNKEEKTALEEDENSGGIDISNTQVSTEEKSVA